MTDVHKVKSLIHSGELQNIRLALELIKSNRIPIDLSPYYQLFDWLNQHENDRISLDKNTQQAQIIEYLLYKETLHFYHNPFLRNISPLCSLLTGLKKIGLHHCDNFEDSGVNFLSQEATLEELDITAIDLETTPIQLEQFTYLKKISLQNCRLKHLPDTVLKLQNLQIIDLSNNAQLTFKQLLKSLPSVIELYLENCQLQQLNHLFSLFPNTTLLNINHNQLAYLDQEFRQVPQLIYLHAAHNQIQLLSPDLAACQQLRSVDLSNNLLDSIPAVLSELTSLEQLNLSYNKMQYADIDQPALKYLVSLDISYNSLKEIPGWLKESSYLKRLNLSGISLRGKLVKINSLKQLETLQLKNCLLSGKDLLNLDWKHLLKFDVRQNSLKKSSLAQLKKQNPTTNIIG